MGAALLLVVLSSSSSALTFDPSQMSPSARAYYDCMMSTSASYAKRSANADEAIDAARDACSKDRLEFIEATAIETYDQMRAKGLNPDPTVIYNATVEATDETDRMTRPHFVRNVLDAK